MEEVTYLSLGRFWLCPVPEAMLGTQIRDKHLLGMNSTPAQASLPQLQLPSGMHPWEEQGCSQPQFM